MHDSRELWCPLASFRSSFSSKCVPLSMPKGTSWYFTLLASLFPTFDYVCHHQASRASETPRRACLTATRCSRCFFLEKLRNLPPHPTTTHHPAVKQEVGVCRRCAANGDKGRQGKATVRGMFWAARCCPRSAA